MKLIIAEKPSVAQTISAALGVKEKKDGYIEAAAVRLRRLPALFGDVRRRGFGRGQRAGRLAAANAHHAADHPRAVDDVRRHQGPQLATGLLVLDHSVHLADRYDGTHPLRHSAVGGRSLARGALRLVRGHGVVRGEDLPRGHLHVCAAV